MKIPLMPSIANPWVILAAVAVLGATNAWTWHATKDNTQTVERAAFAVEQKKVADANAIELARVNGLTLDAQRAHAADLQAMSVDYQLKLEVNNAKAASALARHRSGEQRLSVPTERCIPGPFDNVPGVEPGSRGHSGETRAELSDAAAEFLIGEARTCDAIVEQLTKAQAIMARDRKFIEDFNAGIRGAKP